MVCVQQRLVLRHVAADGVDDGLAHVAQDVGAADGAGVDHLALLDRPVGDGLAGDQPHQRRPRAAAPGCCTTIFGPRAEQQPLHHQQQERAPGTAVATSATRVLLPQQQRAHAAVEHEAQRAPASGSGRAWSWPAASCRRPPPGRSRRGSHRAPGACRARPCAPASAPPRAARAGRRPCRGRSDSATGCRAGSRRARAPAT